MRRILILGYVVFLMLWGCNPDKRLEEATLFLTVITLIVAVVAGGIAIVAILGAGFVKEAHAFYERHVTDFAKILFYDENSPFYDGMVGRPRRKRTPEQLEALLRKIRDARAVLAVEAIHNPVAESYKKILGYRHGDEVFALMSQTYSALTKYRAGELSPEQCREINDYVCERAQQFLELTQTIKQRPFSLVTCSRYYIAYECRLLLGWEISGKK